MDSNHSTPIASRALIPLGSGPFRARAEFYERNVKDGHMLTAGRAVLSTPGGRVEPGVLIYGIGQGHVVVPRAEAIRLATEIADAARTNMPAS
ncbi:MAG: hypothetical protein WBA87_07935 [Microbacterium sp.]